MLRGLYNRLDYLIHEIMKFGLVGLVAYVVDTALFNLCRSALDLPVLRSKVFATVIATTIAYIGNRHWTFRHRERSGLGREYALFFVLNGVGLAITLSCLTISHYLLDFRSLLADNISGQVLGLGLGTLFRFWSYRKWVFREIKPRLETTVDEVVLPSRMPVSVVPELEQVPA